jgi:Flp pilus assembly protein TadD
MIEPHHGLAKVCARAVLLLGLAACSGHLPESVSIEYSPEELLPERAPFYSPGDVDQLSPVSPLALDADMEAFLADIKQRSGSKRALLNNILRGLLGDGTVIQYDNFKTYTAQEAFHAREGNCLAFTNLFVALARAGGLKVYYQEVDIPHNWERQGETWVYNRHISAYVDLDIQGDYYVDFNLNPSEVEFYEVDRISDAEALAQYHNNMGVYWMLAERFDVAYLHFREAISLSGNEAWFWTNLGVLYHRVHDDKRAEAAWLRAVDIGNDHSAESNLARYYRRVGNDEMADLFQDRVRRYRLKNPFYRYELAEAAYYRGDYETSIDQLKAAIRIRNTEEQFHRLLGLNYVKTGQGEKAQKSFANAAAVAESNAAKRVYNEKQKILREGHITPRPVNSG